MAGVASITAFTGLAPPWDLTSLDANFTSVRNLLRAAGTYSNYAADTGAANAYVVDLPANVTFALNAGVMIEFLVTNANTGASTLNVNSSGATALVNWNGGALAPGQLAANSVACVLYNGANWRLVSVQQTGWVLIQTQTASNSATLDFTTNIGAGFDEYLFTISEMVPVTDSTSLLLRVSQNAGVSWLTGASYYSYAGLAVLNGAGPVSAFASTGDTSLSIATSISNAEGLSGEVKFFSPSNTARYKKFLYEVSFNRSGNTPISLVSAAGNFILNTAAINGIRFLMSSGNLSAGVFALYGRLRA